MAVSTVSGLAKATGIGEHYLRQLGVEDKLMVPIGEYLKLITEYNQGLFHRVTTLLARGPQLQQTYRQGQDTARVVTDVTDIDGERTKVAAELHKLRERVEAVVTKLKTFAVSVPGYVEKLKRQKSAAENSVQQLDQQIGADQTSILAASARMQAIDGELAGKQREKSGYESEIGVHNSSYESLDNKIDRRESGIKDARREKSSVERERDEAEREYKKYFKSAKEWAAKFEDEKSTVEANERQVARLKREKQDLGLFDFSKKEDADKWIQDGQRRIEKARSAKDKALQTQNREANRANEARNRLEAAKEKLQEARSLVQYKQTKIDEFIAQRDNVEETIRTKRAHIADCDRTIGRLEAEKSRLVSEINGYDVDGKRAEKARSEGAVTELSQVIDRLAVFSFSNEVVAHFNHIEDVLSSKLGTTLVRVRSGVEAIQGKVGGSTKGLASCIDAFAKLCVKEKVAALPSISGAQMLQY